MPADGVADAVKDEAAVVDGIEPRHALPTVARQAKGVFLVGLIREKQMLAVGAVQVTDELIVARLGGRRGIATQRVAD
ncbi:MAG: hypothetical protein GYA63_03785, partial [Armatimonadetes bacterium]|nr:hypothetical protein [Armatimonadota bacterium]